MISCQKATELISKELEEPLGTKEQLLLKMHLFLCETCELFRRQSALVRKIVQRGKDGQDGPALSDEAKEKIRRSINKS